MAAHESCIQRCAKDNKSPIVAKPKKWNEIEILNVNEKWWNQIKLVFGKKVRITRRSENVYGARTVKSHRKRSIQQAKHWINWHLEKREKTGDGERINGKKEKKMSLNNAHDDFYDVGAVAVAVDRCTQSDDFFKLLVCLSCLSHLVVEMRDWDRKNCE